MFFNAFEIPVIRTIEVINKLKELPHTFHLTGSHFTGSESEESDWDFFVDAASANIEKDILAISGFERNSREYADDDSIVRVYSWNNGDKKVDIQLIDPDLMAWKVLANFVLAPIMCELDKELRQTQEHLPVNLRIQKRAAVKRLKRKIWDASLDAYRFGRTLGKSEV